MSYNHLQISITAVLLNRTLLNAGDAGIRAEGHIMEPMLPLVSF